MSLQTPELAASRPLPPAHTKPLWRRLLGSQEVGLLLVIAAMVIGLTLSVPSISRPQREVLDRSFDFAVEVGAAEIVATSRRNAVALPEGGRVVTIGPGWELSGDRADLPPARYFVADGWSLDNERRPTELRRGSGAAMERVPIVNPAQTLRRIARTGFEVREAGSETGDFYAQADGWRPAPGGGLTREPVVRRFSLADGWRFASEERPRRQVVERVGREEAVPDSAAVEIVEAGWRYADGSGVERDLLRRDGWRADPPGRPTKVSRTNPESGQSEELLLAGGASVARIESGYRVRGPGGERFYADAEGWSLVRRTATGQVISVGTAGALGELERGLLAAGATGRAMEQPPRVNKFLNGDNLITFVTQAAFIAIMAVGMTAIIVLGGIDLSVGSIYALAAVMGALALRSTATWEGGWAAVGSFEAVAIGLVVCCGVGAVCGFINGGASVWLNVHPFIITLGGMAVYRGIAFVMTKGLSISDTPPAYQSVIKLKAWGINPVPALVMLGVGLVGAFVFARTVFGRRVFAIGGNETAARYAGVPVARTKIIAFTIMGALAGLSGGLAFGFLGAAASNDGMGYELYVIAATVIGGAALSGGRGSAMGAVLGAVIMQLIDNGFQALEIDPNYRQIVLGLAIVIAVVVDQAKQRLTARRR